MVCQDLNIYLGSNISTKKLRFELTALDDQLVKSFSSGASNITHLLPVYDVGKLILSEQVVIGR